MSLKPLPLILSAIAALCFIAAFMKPLVCSDFSLEKVPYLDQADDLIDAPCERIVQGIREAEACEGRAGAPVAAAAAPPSAHTAGGQVVQAGAARVEGGEYLLTTYLLTYLLFIEGGEAQKATHTAHCPHTVHLPSTHC